MKRPNTILKNKSDCHINEINSNLLCCKSYNFYQCFFFFGGLKHIDNVWLIPLLFYFGTPVIVGCSKILGNSLTPLFCKHKILDLNDFFLVLVLEWTVLGGFLSLLGSGKRWEVEKCSSSAPQEPHPSKSKPSVSPYGLLWISPHNYQQPPTNLNLSHTQTQATPADTYTHSCTVKRHTHTQIWPLRYWVLFFHRISAVTFDADYHWFWCW